MKLVQEAWKLFHFPLILMNNLKQTESAIF